MLIKTIRKLLVLAIATADLILYELCLAGKSINLYYCLCRFIDSWFVQNIIIKQVFKNFSTVFRSA